MSAAAPALSIVIPTLNEAQRIVGALSALASCRARGCEVVVADGGSDDGTSALAAPLADQVIVAPRGRSRQMNAGAAVARGSLLVFLHADTIAPPDFDRLIITALREAPWGRFDVRIGSDRLALRVVERMMNLRSRITGVATGDQAIFTTRDAFDRAGGFPDIALMEDIALSAALNRLGRPACLRERVVTSGRRWETRGVARTILAMWRLRAAFWLGADTDELAIRYGYAPYRRENEPGR